MCDLQMQREAATIPSGAILRFDVCVVGGGPAGLTVAEDLAAKGWDVGLFESGGAAPERASKQLSRGVHRGLPYFRLDLARSRALGGSSWMWLGETAYWSLDGGLRSRPLDRLDFEPRAHVPLSGWPVAYEEIQPWMRRAFERAGLDFDVLSEPPAGGLPLDGSVVETCASQFAEHDVFRRRIPGLAARSNVEIVTHATVVEIEADREGSAVQRLRLATGPGTWFAVEARQFVIAGGGIENARILLASPLGRPGAAANRFDQLGRHFMEHLHVESGYFEPAAGIAVEQLFARYRVRLAARQKEIWALRIADGVQRENGLLNTVTEFYPRPRLFHARGVRSLAELAWGVRHRSAPEDVGHHVLNIARQPRAAASAAYRAARGTRRQAPELATLVMTAEQAPNPASRVTVARKRDRFGIPLARLEWSLSPLDYRSIRGTQEIIDAQFRAEKLGHIQEFWGETSPTPRIHGCWHHIGTTRMSADPRSGVVDPDCRVHGLPNLWMAGSSTMPTAGAVTVTLTAVALAMRLAARLDQVLR